jgi:hypothetical protein
MLNNLIGLPSFVGCVVIVEKLAAELKIELIDKFLDPLEDGLALLDQIALVVKTRSQHRQKVYISWRKDCQIASAENSTDCFR